MQIAPPTAAPEAPRRHRMAERFRGFLPVVVDVETGGFDSRRHALLEIAAIPILLGEDGRFTAGANAKPEKEALDLIFRHVRAAARDAGCQRAILVGHNAHFDLGFINAAVARVSHKRNPFHPFSTFDTVTLAGMAFGQTVLSRAMQAAGLAWDDGQAHSAVYDAERTAELFCTVLNRWEQRP